MPTKGDIGISLRSFVLLGDGITSDFVVVIEGVIRFVFDGVSVFAAETVVVSI
jgi:hypothetical protein